MAIQTSRLPLSPPDHDSLQALLRHPGFQVLRRVVKAHGAEHAAMAGEALASGSSVEAEEEAAKARRFRAADEVLGEIEEGKLDALRLQLSVG